MLRSAVHALRWGSAEGTGHYSPRMAHTHAQRAVEGIHHAVHVVQGKGVQDSVLGLPLPRRAQRAHHRRQAGMRVQGALWSPCRACRREQRIEQPEGRDMLGSCADPQAGGVPGIE